MRTSFLAAAAAAALLTTGAAVAQDQGNQNMQGGSAPPTHMKGPRAGNQGQSGSESGSMRNEQPGSNLQTQPTSNGPNERTGAPNATSNEPMRGNENMRMNGNLRTNENLTTRERINNNIRNTTNIRNRTNIRLTTVQRTRIRDRVILSGRAPRVTNVNFRVGVGVRVPRNVRVALVPPEIVELFPQWSGYDYFVYGSEIVIVDPASFAIMAVLPI